MTSRKPQTITKTLPRMSANKKQLILGGIVACVLIALGIVHGIRGADKPPKAAPLVQQDMARAETSDTESAITKAKAKIKAESRKVALEEIAAHQEIISRDSSAKDTPDRLMAIGNLYQYQLDDYYSAIQKYRSVVDSYPDNSKVSQAYIELAACYERLGDEAQARYVYQEMVDKLDPNLQRVKYAKLKLEGE